MVKSGWLPTGCSVTAGTVFTKPAFVRIILEMAPHTVHGKCVEIGWGMRIDVAFFALKTLVFANQLESCLAVVKILA